MYTDALGPQLVYSGKINSNNSIVTGTNVRNVIPISSLLRNATTVKIRVRATSANVDISSLWIGHQAASGDVYDFDGNQAEVTFSGGSGCSPTAGTYVDSDNISFTLDITKKLVIAFHLNTLANAPRGTMTGATSHYKTAADESGVTDVSGYSAYNSNQSFMIDIITDPTL